MPVLNFPSYGIDDRAAAQLPSVALEIAAGNTDQVHLAALVERDLVSRDLLYTLAVMCAPEDEGGASRLNEALIAGELYEVARFLENVGAKSLVAGASALAIADREDPRGLLKKMIEHDWLGHIASGYVLRWIVSRWRAEDRISGSLAAAAQGIQAWCQKNKIKGGGAQHITRNVWPKYKSASHLWAAFYICQDAEIEISAAIGFQKFVSTAQWLLETASNLVPKGRRPGEAVLSLENAWQVPPASVLRARRRSGEDLGIVAIWSDDLDRHDIRLTGLPPFLREEV
jgi:hypothetical protein